MSRNVGRAIGKGFAIGCGVFALAIVLLIMGNVFLPGTKIGRLQRASMDALAGEGPRTPPTRERGPRPMPGSWRLGAVMIELLIDTALAFGLLVLAFLPLERAFPAREGQRLLRPAWGVDLAFFLGQYLVWGPLVVLGLTATQELLRPGALSGLRAAVGLQPLWLQVVEAVVLGDLCVYGWHRLCHQVDWLWRFHAVHHSVEHLDWLAAHREHPLDGLTTQLACNLPLFLLGIPLAPLAMVAGFRGMWGAFIHSNVRLPLGPLGFLFGAPDLHHWHHARTERTRHNFANLAPYMDWIFGTYHRPVGEERWALGLTEPFPRGYLGQLVSPLRALLLSVREGHGARHASGGGEAQAADRA